MINPPRVPSFPLWRLPRECGRSELQVVGVGRRKTGSEPGRPAELSLSPEQQPRDFFGPQNELNVPAQRVTDVVAHDRDEFDEAASTRQQSSVIDKGHWSGDHAKFLMTAPDPRA